MEDITNVNGNLTVLPSQNAASLDFVQWIVPFLQFRCHGKITRWSLRVEQLGNLDLEEDDLWYIPQLLTWRESKDQAHSQQVVSYKLQSSTNETIFTVHDKGIVFEYNIPVPTTVEPGDIVGIQMPHDATARRTRTTKPLFLEVGNRNRTTQSYISLHKRTSITIPSKQLDKTESFLPLISVNFCEF